MRIGDLPDPVTASKADWLPGTTWIGFTPQGKGPDAVAKCQAAVRRQFGSGYILERVTHSFEEPNPGFSDDPIVMMDRKRHNELRDGLVAVHRLQPSARPLAEIIGEVEFGRLQDVWSKPGSRRRWSVAFPIVETFEIVGKPKAKDVFSGALYKQIYQSQAALLRPLNDQARAAIQNLEIIPGKAANAWIAIESEIAMAQRATIPRDVKGWIDRDLVNAMEGETEERKVKVRLRAAWMAHRFAMQRSKSGKLFCDGCGFDPSSLADADKISARSCLDVHHLDPLAEGKRLTSFRDLSLLCPTCHRIEHLRIKIGANKVIAA